MSRGYTTSKDRSRRRMATVIIIVGVVVLVGWIAAISALAGGNGGSQQGGAEGAASGGAGSGQQQAAPESTNSENNRESSGEPTDQEPATAQGETPEGGQPPENSSADTQEVFDPLEEGDQQDGSTGGQQSEPQPQPEGGISETDRSRARAVSESYLTAAYGYTGDSSEEYLQAVEQAASEEIYDSPGGSMLKGYSRAAPECGMRSTVILEEFEVIGQSPDGVDVTVTFSVEDADGQTHTFSQDQRLSSSDGAYEVSGVSMEELISQTAPKESCPGAQSSDASSKDASSEGGEGEIKPDSLGVADEDRVRSAADRYITSAYGYTGDSGEEYRRGVERTVDKESFYSSPGGKQVLEYVRAAEEDGITAAAVMESFEITSKDDTKVEGTAYFRVGASYDRYGELEGEGKPFAVDLTLTPVNSAYEVSEASPERGVSARKVGRPQEKKTS